jgi:hypothetical protein
MNNTSFGSDPELCLFDNEQKKFVSAINVLPGRDKHNPIELGDGIKMYHDNILVEASMPPAFTKQEFLGRITITLQKMREFLGNKYSLVPKASHIFDSTELENEKAWEAGCDPNFDAYKNGEQNMAPKFDSGLRSGSFHIHLGNEKLMDWATKLKAIQLLDIFVGVSSILFDSDETASARRKLYGKAGEFRPTEYGLEYRVLGPFPLRSAKATELVIDLIEHVMNHIESNTYEQILSVINSEDVQNAINLNNKELAESILLKANLPEELFNRVKNFSL